MNTPIQESAAVDLAFDWGGELFWRLVQRALWWPSAGALVLTDLHLGKRDCHGCEANVVAELRRVDALVSRFSPSRIVFLGDLVDVTAYRKPIVFKQLQCALASWRGISCFSIIGNHDRPLLDHLADIGLCMRPEGTALGPIALVHHPECAEEGRPTLCGHWHPCTKAGEPCFHFADNRIVLPAFGSIASRRGLRME